MGYAYSASCRSSDFVVLLYASSTVTYFLRALLFQGGWNTSTLKLPGQQIVDPSSIDSIFKVVHNASMAPLTDVPQCTSAPSTNLKREECVITACFLRLSLDETMGQVPKDMSHTNMTKRARTTRQVLLDWRDSNTHWLRNMQVFAIPLTCVPLVIPSTPMVVSMDLYFVVCPLLP